MTTTRDPRIAALVDDVMATAPPPPPFPSPTDERPRRTHRPLIAITITAIVAAGALALVLSLKDTATGPSIVSPAGETTTTPSTTEVPTTSISPLQLAQLGIEVSPNTVKGFLAATFPDSFGGLYATIPDGSAYTIIVVGDPAPIQNAMAERLSDPSLPGPRPVVSYQQGSVTLRDLQNAVGAVSAGEPYNGTTGIVGVGVDERGNGLSIMYVGPTDGVAEALSAKYGVPVTSIMQVSGPGRLAVAAPR
jgi:hypothetical protein